jgi:hypothetical protein
MVPVTKFNVVHFTTESNQDACNLQVIEYLYLQYIGREPIIKIIIIAHAKTNKENLFPP